MLTWKFYFLCGNVKTTHYGIQSTKYLATKIWDLVPDQIKYCGSLTKFKNTIKSWLSEVILADNIIG